MSLKINRQEILSPTINNIFHREYRLINFAREYINKTGFREFNIKCVTVCYGRFDETLLYKRLLERKILVEFKYIMVPMSLHEKDNWFKYCLPNGTRFYLLPLRVQFKCTITKESNLDTVFKLEHYIAENIECDKCGKCIENNLWMISSLKHCATCLGDELLTERRLSVKCSCGKLFVPNMSPSSEYFNISKCLKCRGI